jgi:hypothetical protein
MENSKINLSESDSNPPLLCHYPISIFNYLEERVLGGKRSAEHAIVNIFSPIS